MTDDLIQNLETMLDRWDEDADTLENAGMERKAGQLRQCHAELQHFVQKSVSEKTDEVDTGGSDA